MSFEEYHSPPEEYRSEIREYKAEEYCSQQESEYYESGQIVEIEKPKKSKFKKMLQYFVAGAASAAIIIGGANASKVEVDSVVIELDYDTYEYTIEAGNTYKMSFDETKMDDYYEYLSEYIYKMTNAIDDDIYKAFLRTTSRDYNDSNNLNNRMLYKVPDSKQYRTSSGLFDWLEIDGNKDITTAYQAVSFGSYDYDASGISYSGFYCIELANDENILYLSSLLETYKGLTREEIYEKIQGMTIENASGFFAKTYVLRDGGVYGQDDCEEFFSDNIFYVKDGEQLLIVPTFLKIENLTSTDEIETEEQLPEQEEQIPEQEEQPEQEVPEYEPVVIIDGSNLSAQSYDYAEQVGDNRYLVQKDGLCGLVDYEGNEIVSISYTECSIVGKDEVEFSKDNIAYVYNIENGQLVYEYIKRENVEPEDLEKYTTADGANHHLFIEEWNDCTRSYMDGLLCESLMVEHTYVKEVEHDESINIGPEVGGTSHIRVTYTNVKTGEVIYRGYTGQGVIGIEDSPGILNVVHKFGLSNDNAEAVVLELDVKTGDHYLVTISADGYTKAKVDNVEHFNGNMRYDNGWLLLPWTQSLINTKTMERLEVPYESSSVYMFYYGHDDYYGITIGDRYHQRHALCKGSDILVEDCLSIGFLKNSYMCYQKTEEEYIIIDENGAEITRVKDFTDFIDGKAFVYDGEGIYYVDENWNQISDYIYKGTITRCITGTVQLESQYYLLKEKAE